MTVDRADLTGRVPEHDADVILICEPRKDCADPRTLRWHCMRGHDGAAPGTCPLRVCTPPRKDLA